MPLPCRVMMVLLFGAAPQREFPKLGLDISNPYVYFEGAK